MDQLNLINQSTAIIITLGISLLFIVVGISYSKKHQGLNNYLLANRSIGVFSLTASLVSSALGAWILFGPASAATWGGIGAVIGYALGTAFPLFILIYLGEKFRKNYSWDAKFCCCHDLVCHQLPLVQSFHLQIRTRNVR